MSRFSIKTFFAVIFLIVVIFASLLQPNLIWAMILEVVSALLLFILIAVAIGSHGKFRLQTFSFIVIALLFHLCVLNRVDTVRSAYTSVCASVCDALGTADFQPETSVAGEWVKQSGNHFTIYSADGGAAPSSDAEVKSSGLQPYVYSRWAISDRRYFDVTFQHLSAILIGLLGFLLTGFVYDRRRQGD